MRIFCGLTTAGDAVAAALVNERGGVVATNIVADDPLGYITLCHMWARHSDLASVSVADDGTTQVLTTLARAAGLHTAAANPPQQPSEEPLDNAVHIGRQLAGGELVSGAGGTSAPPLRRLVLSAQAMTSTAHTAQGTLIEVLRQCHPAVLSAWEDPIEPAALELLRVIPDPTSATTVDPNEIAARLEKVADPVRVAQLAGELAMVSTDREVRAEAGVAEAIAAAAEVVLSCHAAIRGLAAAITEQLAPVKRRRPANAGKPLPRPRRSTVNPESAQPPVAAAPPPPAPARGKPSPTPKPAPDPLTVALPNRETPAAQQPDEVAAAPTAAPPQRGVRTTPPRGLDTEGFPRMPEPPEFLEPVTTDLRANGTSAEPDLLSADLPPELDEADDDLLIFSQARSAWFKGPSAIDDGEEWNTPVDEGWRAAAAASDVDANETTGSGLPRRVPQANLVPGSAIFSDSPSEPIKRDASALARHTAGYFRGWGRARRETVGAGSR